MPRVLLDTNVIFTALRSQRNSASATVVTRVLSREWTCVLSTATYLELVDVLYRESAGFPRNLVTTFLNDLADCAEW